MKIKNNLKALLLSAFYFEFNALSDIMHT